MNGDCMCVDQNNTTNSASSDVKVDIIDSWHKCWPAVLSDFAQNNRQARLLVDQDGWLSARQVLLVAFGNNGTLAGHLVFRLVPQATRLAELEERPKVDACLDSFEVSTGFDDANVRAALISAASERARSLKIESIDGI